VGAVLAAVLVGSFTAPAPVTALAADAARVAFASDCEVRLWTPAARRAPRLGSLPCPRTSTGSGIAAVSLAGNRALWLHFTGGNIREWSLWTATPTSRPKRLRFVAQDVDLPPPIVLGEGDASQFGDLLPYAVGDEVIVLRADGSRRFAWRAPGRVLDISANSGQLAVLSADGDGTLTLLDGAGSVFGRGSFVGRVGDADHGQRNRPPGRPNASRRRRARPAATRTRPTRGWIRDARPLRRRR